MKNTKNQALKISLIFTLLFLSFSLCFGVKKAYAMPFYDLKPKFLTERATFSTRYETSSVERKHNISLASKTLNNTIVDVGAEFSFNQTIGPRTEKRGYKTAKIISGGEFVDGVGGGVCQVSTTLYNAVIRAGLTVTEYHPHSLQVSYVLPSTDAMVNSGSADFRFVNNTNNPVIIQSSVLNNTLTIKIVGEPLQVEYQIESEIKEKIPAPNYLVLKDDLGEYPELYEGERLYLSYSKEGLKSVAYIVTRKNGKIISRKKLRSDTYKAVRGKVIEGTAKRPLTENLEENNIMN